MSSPLTDLFDMSPWPEHLLEQLAQAPAVLVTVAHTQGSVPRELGTWMGVFADRVVGTIGGGQLEHQAMAQARRLLQYPQLPASPQRLALGPSLGQCCGGVVMLNFERLHTSDSARLKQRLRTPLAPVALFGGGHVGHALARLLLTLPYALTWIDSREGVFPTGLPARVHCEHAEPVHSAVPDLAPGSEVLIMSFSHAEDLDIVAACLKRQRAQGDLAFVGLIGSHTKWASFSHRLLARGFSPEELAQVSCPIGLPGLVGKEPEVIAVAVAAQLLMRRTPMHIKS
jgi:xanthine dehydrogenase accessory factor